MTNGVARFFDEQSEIEKQLYVELLSGVASLSKLFSQSKSPFIYYRAMEKAFCTAFDAVDYSRSDISADAGKDGVGIGLKTFLQNNGTTFQKVAEFNRDSRIFRDLPAPELITEVAKMRNRRIQSTKQICNVDHMIYHVVTRAPGYLAIYEENMDVIQIDQIRITDLNEQAIRFHDGVHEYSFNRSKSTLLKRFDTAEQPEVFGFEVERLDDPFELLLRTSGFPATRVRELAHSHEPTKRGEEIADYIVLPLYSPRSREVQVRSGLNQWNAQGRTRNADEVYIPIPSWIHFSKPGFFEYSGSDRKTQPFDVRIPSGDLLSMRVAQQGGKALMSNPNSALGEWLLRDVLGVEPNVLVTRSDLEEIGVDSVKLSKLKDGSYTLDFLKPGSFEDFEAEFSVG